MSYRDDLDAARQRGDALERELTEAKEKLGELDGKSATAMVLRRRAELARRDSDASATKWFGAPLRVEREHTIDGELSEDNFVDVVDFLRRHWEQAGEVSTLKGSLAWTTGKSQNAGKPAASFYINVRGGKTHLRVEGNNGQIAGGVYGGIGAGVGIGAMMAPGALFLVSPLVGALAIPLWIGGIYGLCRKVYKKVVNKRTTKIDEAFEAVIEIAEASIAETESAKS